MRRYAYFIALVLVVLLGAGLRLYSLSTVPTELIVDELDLYNSAQSIATTGHDIDGTLKPFLYSQFTRNPPMYGLAGYASSLVLGKNAFGLRFPAALFGIAAILLTYAIVLELTRRRDAAIVAAFLVAVQPIFIQFSRIAWEPSSELPFLLGGLYLLLLAFRRDDGVSFKHLACGMVLLALTCYTYMAGWFYAVVLGGPILALNARRLRSWKTAAIIGAGCAIWLILSAPALDMLFFDPLTASRTGRVSTFSSRISLASLGTFAMNYLAQFRWSYLVTSGDPKPGVTWRYLNGFGAFYWFVIPLAAIGIVTAFRYVREKWQVYWLWLWLLAYPLGGALTNDGGGAPNAPRTLAGAPVFCVLAALGLTYLGERSRKLVLGAFAAAAGTSGVLFCSFYFTRYVHVNSNAWDSGTRAMFADVRAHAYAYDRVCFSVRQAWYGIDTYIRFYLDDMAIEKIDNVDEPACFLPGTMLVTDPDRPVDRRGFTTIARVTDVDGSKFAVIRARPRL
jgi:4-amino-4-deoxy-L-arabinose transferase-like glycosyltransferase